MNKKVIIVLYKIIFFISCTLFTSFPNELTIPSCHVGLISIETLGHIQNHYYHLDYISPKTMGISALSSLKESFPNIDFQIETNSVLIQVEQHQKRFLFPSDLQEKPAALLQLKESSKNILTFVCNALSQAKHKPLPHHIEYRFLQGMVSALDPHSTFQQPAIQQPTIQNLVPSQEINDHLMYGFGISYVEKQEHLLISKCFPQSPAWKAGIRRGDQIVQIGDSFPHHIEEAQTLFQTTPEPIKICTRPPVKPLGRKSLLLKEAEPSCVDIKRAQFPISLLFASLLSTPTGKKVGYLRIFELRPPISKQTTKALQQWYQQRISGLILDLRGNPGGEITETIGVLNEWLTTGTLAFLVSPHSGKTHTFSAQYKIRPTYPIVVLVDEYTASGAELIAGTLQTRNRALVIGLPTIGKGTKQSIFQNTDGSSVKITTQDYLLPDQSSIQNIGIIPDIQISPIYNALDPNQTEFTKPTKREKDYPTALPNRFKKPIPKSIYQFSYPWKPPQGTNCHSDEYPSSINTRPSLACDVEPACCLHDETVSFALSILSKTSQTERQQMLEELSPWLQSYQMQK